jgi:EAL domain-containing protein (putative c-di-GMP-specific phosphodiesterase class I)
MNLDRGKVSHYEALLRLTDENGKPCNTGELVKTCEVFGLIGRLDHAVVKACLAQIAHLPDGCGVAINLSGKSIGDPQLLGFIEATIKEKNIDPSRIIFELTETAAFYNLDEVRHFVRRIKSLGCRFALDDFGVGFSSFYYIKELDFDYLKLDGSFIANLPRNPNDQVFVRAMVEISKVFGLSVIAEWVEDQDTADMLRSFGVAYGQGYHFGKAMPLGAR